MTGNDDTRIEAVLDEVEALLDARRDDEARRVLASLDERATGDPWLACRCGDLHLALGDTGRAERAYRHATALDPSWADPYHGLGLACQMRGDRQGMIEAWLRTRQLDLGAPPVPWHMDEAEFEEVAARALAELPDNARAHLANVPIFVEDVPSEALIRSGIDPRLLGLFSGTPLPYRSSIDGQVPELDAIYLFQANLERASGGRERLLDEIRITVLHETAHFFGLEDDDLHDIGLG